MIKMRHLFASVAAATLTIGCSPEQSEEPINLNCYFPESVYEKPLSISVTVKLNSKFAVVVVDGNEKQWDAEVTDHSIELNYQRDEWQSVLRIGRVNGAATLIHDDKDTEEQNQFYQGKCKPSVSKI